MCENDTASRANPTFLILVSFYKCISLSFHFADHHSDTLHPFSLFHHAPNSLLSQVFFITRES